MRPVVVRGVASGRLYEFDGSQPTLYVAEGDAAALLRLGRAADRCHALARFDELPDDLVWVQVLRIGMGERPCLRRQRLISRTLARPAAPPRTHT